MARGVVDICNKIKEKKVVNSSFLLRFPKSLKDDFELFSKENNISLNSLFVEVLKDFLESKKQSVEVDIWFHNLLTFYDEWFNYPLELSEKIKKKEIEKKKLKKEMKKK